MLDLRDLGCAVAEMMDIFPQIEAKRCDMREISVIDEHERKIPGINPFALRNLSGKRTVNILRSDLARIVYDAAQNGVKYVFGNSIKAIEEKNTGVRVTFANGSTEEFDLVIGADGENSLTRSLTFGEKPLYERYCGYYVSAFTIPKVLVPEGTMVQYCMPGKRITVYGIRGGKSVAEFIFRSRKELRFEPYDTKKQKEILVGVFSSGDAQCSRLLQEMETASDFYLDSVSQIRMNGWCNGRTVLIGDAAHCASLLSGKGASLALAGAYILAHELQRSGDDVMLGLKNYERVFRPFVERVQNRTLLSASVQIPATAIGLWVRNQTLRFFSSSAARFFPNRIFQMIAGIRFTLPSCNC